MADIGASIVDLAVRGYPATVFATDLQDMSCGRQRNELVATKQWRGYGGGKGGYQWGRPPQPAGGGLRERQRRRTPGGTYPTCEGSDTGLPVSFACCARPKAKQSTAQTPATGTAAAATQANVSPRAANMPSTPTPATSPPR